MSNTDSEIIKALKIEISRLQGELECKDKELIQASQTLMQLVGENFSLKDENQALKIENEAVIHENERLSGKVESVSKVGYRLIEMIEQMNE